MLTKAEKQFQGIENQLLLTEATLLYPPFLKKAFDNHIVYQRTYEHFIEKLAAMIKNNKNNDEHNLNKTFSNTNIIENETSEIWKRLFTFFENCVAVTVMGSVENLKQIRCSMPRKNLFRYSITCHAMRSCRRYCFVIFIIVAFGIFDNRPLCV